MLLAGGSAPAVLNAANEIAVQAFLDRRLAFTGIERTVARTLDALANMPVACLEDVLEADARARAQAETEIA